MLYIHADLPLVNNILKFIFQINVLKPAHEMLVLIALLSNECSGQPMQMSLNADKMYCRMVQLEHSAILLTFIKLPFVIKIFVLSIFEWSLKTGFTVVPKSQELAYFGI